MKFSNKYSLKNGVIFLDNKEMSQEEVLRDLVGKADLLNKSDDLLLTIPENPAHKGCLANDGTHVSTLIKANNGILIDFGPIRLR